MSLGDAFEGIRFRAADLGDRVRGGMRSRRSAKVDRLPAEVQPGLQRDELAQRREALERQLAELQFELGGLVYEMAIRDHFRLDTVARQAARIQELDAELGSIDRMLRMEDAGAAGSCPSCGSLYARGAVYCSQCGHDLLQRSAMETPPPAATAAPPAAAQPQAPDGGQPQPPAPRVGAAPEGTRWPGQA